jgi:predicted ATPase
LTAKNAPAIAQICLRLDGIPLAIELAAARTKVFPPEEIAARLNDRFRLLTSGSRTALPRHQTLFALIDWSHQLLSEGERALLRRLSIFAGSWSFEAAQEVCGDGLGDAVLDTLAHLVDKSLVVVEEQTEGAEGRYRLLETIRQYARDKLLESGEAEQARDRHLEFFLQFAEAAAPNLLGPEQLLWRKRLETEHDNVRAALEWALARNADAALRLAAAMHYLWSGGGYATEGRKWLQQALTAVERADAIEGELARARLAAQARALTGLGQLAIDQGDNVAARLALEQGSTLARAVGDRRQLALALCLLAVLNWVVGDGGAARTAAEESLVHARAVGDKFLMTMAFSILALVRAVEGDHESAQAYLEQSAQLAREIGNPFAMAVASRTLGHSAFTRGHYAEARAHFSESQTLFRALGDKHFVTSTQSELANIARLEGDYAQAVPLYQQTIAAWQELGHRSGIARCLECLAMIAGAQGHAQRAARLFGAAESLRESIGTPPTPEEQIENEQVMPTIRAQLDEAAFNAAWAEGRALTMEQANADALSLTAE